METNIIEVVAIVAICGFVGFGVKSASGGKEAVTKWIPVIAGVLGGIIGLGARSVIPALAGMDVLSAIASGIASGLASTGLHQAIKQQTGGTGTEG
jgi:hypothetical protein